MSKYTSLNDDALISHGNELAKTSLNMAELISKGGEALFMSRNGQQIAALWGADTKEWMEEMRTRRKLIKDFKPLYVVLWDHMHDALEPILITTSLSESVGSHAHA